VAVVMWSNRLKMKMFHRAMIRKLRIRRDSLCMQPGSAYLGTLVSELREYPWSALDSCISTSWASMEICVVVWQIRFRPRTSRCALSRNGALSYLCVLCLRYGMYWAQHHYFSIGKKNMITDMHLANSNSSWDNTWLSSPCNGCSAYYNSAMEASAAAAGRQIKRVGNF